MNTVYTLPSCVQCTATKRFLDQNGVEYETVDLAEDDAALELVRSWGHSAAPVVFDGQSSFSGFRPDRLKMLV